MHLQCGPVLLELQAKQSLQSYERFSEKNFLLKLLKQAAMVVIIF